MSKHKKRVSLAQQSATASSLSTRQATPPPSAADVRDEPQATESEAGQEAETVGMESPDLRDERPGIESQPVFWFILGALTVGIIVLLGLLLMVPSSAKGSVPARSPTPTAVRVATTTPLAATIPAQAAQPNIAATVTAAVKANESVPRISLEETKQRLDAGSILLVDVRSKDSYTEKHAKGAINIPEPDTQSRLSEFPRDRDIVLYCA